MAEKATGIERGELSPHEVLKMVVTHSSETGRRKGDVAAGFVESMILLPLAYDLELTPGEIETIKYYAILAADAVRRNEEDQNVINPLTTIDQMFKSLSSEYCSKDPDLIKDVYFARARLRERQKVLKGFYNEEINVQGINGDVNPSEIINILCQNEIEKRRYEDPEWMEKINGHFYTVLTTGILGGGDPKYVDLLGLLRKLDAGSAIDSVVSASKRAMNETPGSGISPLLNYSTNFPGMYVHLTGTARASRFALGMSFDPDVVGRIIQSSDMPLLGRITDGAVSSRLAASLRDLSRP